MPHITTFDSKQRYIFVSVFVISNSGQKHEFDALLDTGAPFTEFSDQALHYAGFLEKANKGVKLKSNLQTQKYGKVRLSKVEICSHTLNDFEVYVSRFEKSWGIDALIGLDFFRCHKVTIDYKSASIMTDAI